ncbi:DUF6286 domain-containing protein [Hoyosella altamirensis]|uniref:DUF6286 domain-containing protein n=1 Tax=Hoyosella altamirensis TaxID=616997 RepID=A0A839RNK1_9ACTN|nr:DUF6286 domain-containing protein [Hoyosella altamirensis]MBB3037768.1 hypothetical protein [Hoyosella altamirensis]
MRKQRNKTPRPLGAPGSVFGALLVVFLLVGAGALMVWDFLVTRELVTGTAWIPWAAQQLDGLSAAAWMVPLGVVLGLVGIWLLWLSVKPRPPLAVPADGETVWVSPKVMAALAKAAVQDVSGIVGVKTSATPKRIKVTAAVWGAAPDDLEAQLRRDVEQRLAGLERIPPVKVNVRREGASQ